MTKRLFPSKWQSERRVSELKFSKLDLSVYSKYARAPFQEPHDQVFAALTYRFYGKGIDNNRDHYASGWILNSELFQ